MLYKGDCQSNSFAMHAGTGLHLQQHLHNKSWQLSIVQPVSISGETCKGGGHINYFTASASPILTRGQIFWLLLVSAPPPPMSLQVLYHIYMPSFGILETMFCYAAQVGFEHTTILGPPLKVYTIITGFNIFLNFERWLNKNFMAP